ncbi:hypothetical protein [Tomitella cavernea]|uniref:N-acetylmuramoyl-L-alanine amidase n=1 Tax=Tomitella cavernea TaxID=1387982 RepID=A0ABP9BYA4_9ACTN
MKRSAFASLLLAGVTAAAFVVLATSAAADDVSGDALAGKTVFLDPGHQESAAGHDMSKQVDDGYGGTKNCQTSGMTALGGTPSMRSPTTWRRSSRAPCSSWGRTWS